MTPRDLLSAASWGDARTAHTAAPLPPGMARRSVPLDRLADVLSERAFVLPDPDLSDGPANVRAAFGAPVGWRVDGPAPGVVRRCGARRRGSDATLLAACWETAELARRHAGHAALSRAVAGPADADGHHDVGPTGQGSATPVSGVRRRPRLPHAATRVSARILRAVLLVLGVAAGIRWALPLQGVEGRCPPSGEGYGYCYLQKSVLPAVMVALAPVLGAQLLGSFATRTAPDLLRRWRAGERPTRITTRQASAPYTEDPVLLAASWGVRTGADGPEG